jgi:hypothetical protein
MLDKLRRVTLFGWMCFFAFAPLWALLGAMVLGALAFVVVGAWREAGMWGLLGVAWCFIVALCILCLSTDRDPPLYRRD